MARLWTDEDANKAFDEIMSMTDRQVISTYGSELSCVFCDQPLSCDSAVLDDFGACACPKCSETEIKTQERERN